MLVHYVGWPSEHKGLRPGSSQMNREEAREWSLLGVEDGFDDNDEKGRRSVGCKNSMSIWVVYIKVQ